MRSSKLLSNTCLPSLIGADLNEASAWVWHVRSNSLAILPKLHLRFHLKSLLVRKHGVSVSIPIIEILIQFIKVVILSQGWEVPSFSIFVLGSIFRWFWPIFWSFLRSTSSKHASLMLCIGSYLLKIAKFLIFRKNVLIWWQLLLNYIRSAQPWGLLYVYRILVSYLLGTNILSRGLIRWSDYVVFGVS